MTESPELLLRAAKSTDVAAIATLWHSAWLDGHSSHVPDALLPHRGLAMFRARVPARIKTTTVALTDTRIVGFVTVHDAELEQLFVARDARGSGAAPALLQHAEAQIAQRFDRAWLAVVAGNARARHFYARHGWLDTGPFDYAAEIAGGTIVIVSHRYQKPLRRD
jgi:ribosomal protein S18 acetylase RimI-like enzyme